MARGGTLNSTDGRLRHPKRITMTRPRRPWRGLAGPGPADQDSTLPAVPEPQDLPDSVSDAVEPLPAPSPEPASTPMTQTPVTVISPAPLTGSAPQSSVSRSAGRGRRLMSRLLAKSGLTSHRQPPVDLTGWTVAEYLVERDRDKNDPFVQRRAGHEAVSLINRMSGVLPAGAVPVARAITDAAPPVGERVVPALRDVLDRYLPETLQAFNAEALPELRVRAEHLLTTQLDLLYDATAALLHAQVDDDDRDLQVQAAFLHERFAGMAPGRLDLAPLSGTTSRSRTAAVYVPDLPSAMRRPSLAMPPVEGRTHVRHDMQPVVLFGGDRAGNTRFKLRMALPKGHVATVGVVSETLQGVVCFDQTSNRRFFTLRRVTGFPAAQVDLGLRLNTFDVRRFMVYASTTQQADPTSTVLFMRRGSEQADLPTLLTNDPRVPLTVIATGVDVQGGIMVRNESTLFPDLRTACTAFGFDQVAWLDQDTPVI
ncbi:hypothetical protein KEM60_02632 [Austwickia sp. TVS 96-490-7B]|nr:hypothetical protein [Austwickia sp. TVS 96-490-7B]